MCVWHFYGEHKPKSSQWKCMVEMMKYGKPHAYTHKHQHKNGRITRNDRCLASFKWNQNCCSRWNGAISFDDGKRDLSLCQKYIFIYIECKREQQALRARTVTSQRLQHAIIQALMEFIVSPSLIYSTNIVSVFDPFEVIRKPFKVIIITFRRPNRMSSGGLKSINFKLYLFSPMPCQSLCNSLLESLLLSQHIFILAFYFRTALAAIIRTGPSASSVCSIHHHHVICPFFLPEDEIRSTFFHSTNETTDSI